MNSHRPPFTQSLDDTNPAALQASTMPLPTQVDQFNVPHPSIPSFASHAARNPLQPIIPPNQRPVQRINKLPQHAAQIIRQQQQGKFLLDLTEFQSTQIKTIADLAVKYHRKPEYMKKVMTSQTHYKKKRATNLYNAKLAYKQRELQRAGMPPLKLHELQQAVLADASLQELNAERRDELIQLLEEEKLVKKTGVRINNRAATHDYRYTIDRIGEEIASLESRTGATAFAFFSRSHINDSMQPEWVSTSDALEFLPESMQTSAGEMGRKLELWACNKDSRKTKGELQTLQSECSETITQKLKETLHSRDAKMSYQYYQADIRSRYKVQLRGWPAGVRFIAPGKMTTLWEIRTLHDALHSGSCCWVSMSPQELEELSRQLGEQAVVKKRRSRKPRDENRKEGAPQRKRRGKKSAPVVESDGEGGA